MADGNLLQNCNKVFERFSDIGTIDRKQAGGTTACGVSALAQEKTEALISGGTYSAFGR
jgi:hypothetical protein